LSASPRYPLLVAGTDKHSVSLGKTVKRKKEKKREKRSSKKCEFLAIWTQFLKFKLAENCVFFDETPESGPKKFENRRKII
jgi:hypothetical protein